MRRSSRVNLYWFHVCTSRYGFYSLHCGATVFVVVSGDYWFLCRLLQRINDDAQFELRYITASVWLTSIVYKLWIMLGREGVWAPSKNKIDGSALRQLTLCRLFWHSAYPAPWVARHDAQVVRELRVFYLVIRASPVVLANYFNHVLSNNHNNLFFLVAVAEHFVVCRMSLVAFSLYGGYCTTSCDFCCVEDPCRGWILLPFSEGALDFVQDSGFFEFVCGCTVDIPQAYLTFHHSVEVDRDSNGNVG